MKKSKTVLLFFIISSFCFIFSCRETPPTPREQLMDTGIFGEHLLNPIRTVNKSQGYLKGKFFLFVGAIEGELKSEPQLQFEWELKKGETIISTLPHSKFKFITNNAMKIPTVEFVFDKDWADFDNTSVGSAFWIYYSDSFKKNLNNFIMGMSPLTLAIIRGSRADIEKALSESY